MTMITPSSRHSARTEERSFVLSERKDGVDLIRINRPQYLHTLNMAVFHQIQKAVESAIAAPDVRGIVISTTGPGFVVGADLTHFRRFVETDRMDLFHFMAKTGNNCYDTIESSPKPVVAAINGVALGGGLELILACHYRYAIASGMFALPETGLGLCPSWGAAIRLPKLVGLPLAKWIGYTGKNLTSKDAFSLGIIDAIIPGDSLLEAAFRKSKNPESQLGGPRSVFPDANVLVDYFGTNKVEQIYNDDPSRYDNRTLAAAVRQTKKNSLLAMVALEKVFAADLSTVEKRDSTYNSINDRLNRSEDTLLGLTWRLAKKVGLPPFSTTSISHD